MTSKLAKGIIGNGLAQITLKVIRILDQLLLVPFFLLVWGDAYYGEWLTISIIPAILGFTDLGIGAAAGNSFVLAYTGDNKQHAANIRKSGIVIISCSILLGAILTVIVLWAAEGLHLFDKTLISAKDAIVAISLLMTAKLFSFFHQLIEGYFRGERKSALGSFIYSIHPTTNLLVGFCALYAGCGVIGYALSQLIASVLFTTAFLIIGNKMIDLKGYKGQLIISDVKTIAMKGLGYMMNPIWQSIFFQGSTLVVRMVLGPESVAIFNTMRTACRSISQGFSIIIAAVFPELQYEYGKGNIVIVHRLFRLSVLVSVFIGGLGSVLLALFGLEIYNLWTLNTLIVSYDIWLILILGVFLNSVWWTGIIVYSVVNKPYHFAVISIVSACLSIIASYCLSLYFGLWGAIFGSILFEIMMLFYVLPDSCSLLGMKVCDLFSHSKEDYTFIKRKILSIKNK